jgi:hypothetical protein
LQNELSIGALFLASHLMIICFPELEAFSRFLVAMQQTSLQPEWAGEETCFEVRECRSP